MMSLDYTRDQLWIKLSPHSLSESCLIHCAQDSSVPFRMVSNSSKRRCIALLFGFKAYSSSQQYVTRHMRTYI